jgi:hypothetical protein
MPTDAKPDPELPDGTPVDTEVAWLVGAAVGDGTVTDKGLRLCLYGDDRERAARTITDRWGGHPSHGASYGLVVSNVRLRDALTGLGMRRLGPDKRVPDAVWSWSEPLQRAFLDGYCDADGHRPADTAKHGERTYHSASEDLIEDVRALHVALGDAVSNITVTKRTKPITIKGKVVRYARPQYSFTMWSRNGRGETVLRQRPGIAAWLDAGDFTLAAVLEVRAEGEQDTWDIEVEGAHNFIADGVVVHNSGFMSAVYNVLTGRSPYSRRFTTASMGSTAAGLGFRSGLGGPFAVGWFTGSPGHMAGTLAGANVESRGSAGVLFGPSGRGANHGLFNRHAFLGQGAFIGGGGGGGGFPAVTLPAVPSFDPFRHWVQESGRSSSRHTRDDAQRYIDRLFAYSTGGTGGPGTFLVGEDGPEIVDVPVRARVTPLQPGEQYVTHDQFHVMAGQALQAQAGAVVEALHAQTAALTAALVANSTATVHGLAGPVNGVAGAVRGAADHVATHVHRALDHPTNALETLVRMGQRNAPGLTVYEDLSSTWNAMRRA